MIIDDKNKNILLFDPLRVKIFDSLINLFSESEEFRSFKLYSNTNNFQIEDVECGPITMELLLSVCQLKLWENNFKFDQYDPNLNFTIQTLRLISWRIPNSANPFIEGGIKAFTELMSVGRFREKQNTYLHEPESRWKELGILPKAKDIQKFAEAELQSNQAIKKLGKVKGEYIETPTPGEGEINTSEVIDSKNVIDKSDNKPKLPSKVATENKNPSIISRFLQLALIACIIECIKYIINLPGKLASKLGIIGISTLASGTSVDTNSPPPPVTGMKDPDSPTNQVD